MANTPNINLVKPLGTDKALVSVINENSEKIDAFAGATNTSIAKTQDGYAIVVNGNNAPKAITAGQYLFIKNHSSLDAGGYHATANIANGAAITSSNVTADADGVVNGAFSALNSNIKDLQIGSGGLIENTDLNSLTATGQYRIWRNNTNAPKTNIEGLLVVENSFNVPNSYISQKLYSYTGRIYTRFYGYGSWTSWQELALNTVITAISNANDFNGALHDALHAVHSAIGLQNMAIGIMNRFILTWANHDYYFGDVVKVENNYCKGTVSNGASFYVWTLQISSDTLTVTTV